MRIQCVKFVLMIITVGAVSLSAQAQPQPQENPMKEFILSCTYGVLAGTLVGAATLAFTSQPGEHLYRVARGASIGLYTGILLGVYVVYVVPGQGEPENPENAFLLPTRKPMAWSLLPLANPISGVMDGASLQWLAWRF
jgi:hypothetical protein